MGSCGHNGEYNQSTLLCVTCNTTNFEIIDKIDSREVIARCGSCGQETDLSVIVGARYGGAMEVVAALRSLYAVNHYQAKMGNDEVGKARYFKKHVQLQQIIKGAAYENPLDIAAALFELIEHKEINMAEARQVLAIIMEKAEMEKE